MKERRVSNGGRVTCTTAEVDAGLLCSDSLEITHKHHTHTDTSTQKKRTVFVKVNSYVYGSLHTKIHPSL